MQRLCAFATARGPVIPDQSGRCGGAFLHSVQTSVQTQHVCTPPLQHPHPHAEPGAAIDAALVAEIVAAAQRNNSDNDVATTALEVIPATRHPKFTYDATRRAYE